MWQAIDINSDSEYMICSPVILSRTGIHVRDLWSRHEQK